MPRQLLGLATFLGVFELVMAQNCSLIWEQCGGLEWDGVECCETGSSCIELNDYYSQCQPNSDLTTLSTATGTGIATASPSTTRTSPATYTTTDTEVVPEHTQEAYPDVSGEDTCGAWVLVDNVCCPSYCEDDLLTESCRDGCTCVTPPSDDCSSSDEYPETHDVTEDMEWHYSRSTHFGLTSGGACGFGLYSLCTQGSLTADWTDAMLGNTCDAFCTAYPTLCADPDGATWRGNFMAPNGNYYTQFWASLPGDRDNYLSCGECFEVVRTRPDGSEYEVGEEGYT
ncbi:hypothetical protein MKZ38_001613 [Zalerion maritima]|uniref:CBM1 domain-containing protein n=1 Tax=Zalerion maritima TaxID=339359 RepID=A0AAD5RFZ2_9PEZI|nr:hypothetical protein MKZ38_001613 [Zalerion maritima]